MIASVFRSPRVVANVVNSCFSCRRGHTLRACSPPIIDISPFTLKSSSAVKEEEVQVLKQVGAACETHGFMVIVGHGIPESVRTGMFNAAKDFFALKSEDKLSLNNRSANPAYRGYVPFQGENIGQVFGGDPLALPDPVEKFCCGSPDLADLVAANPSWYPPIELSAAYATNIWPTQLPAFQHAVESYYNNVQSLAHTMLQIFAQSLGVPDNNFFKQHFTKGGQNLLRCLHYPMKESGGAAHCLHPHTDGTLLTVLMQDATGGLEVLVNDEWQPVATVPNAFVVNIGDLMMHWTNDRWKSTWHRVSFNRARSARLSFPLFCTPDHDTVIECHPSFLRSGEKPKYAPVSLDEWNRARMNNLILEK